MTRSPCYDHITHRDCPRRYVGCRAECEKWHEWLIIHAEEVEAARKRKQQFDDVESFLTEQGERIRRINHERSEQRKREGRRK